MGYSIRLVDENGRAVKVSPHQEGSIIASSGNNRADMTVTYNYAPHFYALLDPDQGLRWLYGKPFDEVRDRLEAAVVKLGTDRSGNYWDATPGNAGYILRVLYYWSQENPTATFSGD